MKYLLLILLLFIVGCSTPSEPVDGEILSTLNSPWGMSFVGSDLLITQKSGELLYYDFNEAFEISGIPDVVSSGQGGLLDVEYHEGHVYLTYSASGNGGIATHLGRGILNLDEFRLDNFEVLLVVEPFLSGGAHFGSRVLIQDDFLYMTTGDRGSKDFSENHPSQNISNYIGAVLRLHTNGSYVSDNPFSNAIYTYGHRNVQGIAYFNGSIYISEHGEQDGDAIHLLEMGGNYGWPIAHYGCTYGLGRKIGDFPHQRDDVVNPIHYWECGSGGYPPAGMDFYNGNLFLGNLRGSYLGEFAFENGSLVEINRYIQGERIRDVLAFEKGVYALTDSGKLVRVVLD